LWNEINGFVGIWLNVALRRFYADVNVVELEKATKDSPGSWGINLDKRQLRTPNRKVFEVDNEAVAQAVAYEWAKQKGTILLHTMHMVSTCIS
jgi:chaperone required for assembly of F1-ATPase